AMSVAPPDRKNEHARQRPDDDEHGQDQSEVVPALPGALDAVLEVREGPLDGHEERQADDGDDRREVVQTLEQVVHASAPEVAKRYSTFGQYVQFWELHRNRKCLFYFGRAFAALGQDAST